MESASLMRLAPLVTALWFAAGCFAAPSLDGAFRCDKDLRCPDERTCITGCCVSDDGDDDDADQCLGFVHFSRSTFTRGCDGSSCPVDAQPARMIAVSSFKLQDHEVTQAEYAWCGRGRCQPPSTLIYDPDNTPDLPVRGLSWQQATAYCQYLGGRLPREAEWERAARELDPTAPYPWGSISPTCDRANYSGCGGVVLPRHAADGTPSGLYDLAGNVREWVYDRYGETYYANGSDENPTGPDDGADGVVRGGGFRSDPVALQVWWRAPVPLTDEQDDVGVRCAKPTD